MILTVTLIVLASYLDYRPAEVPTGNGYGTKQKGDSGLIIPGNGEEMAEVNFEPMQGDKRENKPLEKTQLTEEKSIPNSTADKTEAVATSEETKEEHNSMNDILLSFWHGVVTVLIGETVALMVAVAWMKIRGGK